jgi:hypothetical protein
MLQQKAIRKPESSRYGGARDDSDPNRGNLPMYGVGRGEVTYHYS